MRRIAFIFAGVIAVLALLAGTAFLFLFHTSAGRAFITAIAERELGEALGAEVNILKLEGRLPNHLVLTSIEVADDSGVWFRVERIELDWHALRILRKRVDVERLAVTGARLIRKPPQRESKGERRDVFKAPSLPRNLPDVAIRTFTLDDFEAAPAIVGRAVRIDAGGNLSMGGRRLVLRLDAGSAGDTDTVNAVVSLDPDAERGSIDVLVASHSDGVLATLADLGGPLFVEARGEAPLDAFTADIDAQIGAYGTIDGAVSANLQTAETLRADIRLTLGEGLSDIANEIGQNVSLSATLAYAGKDVLLEVERLDAAAGEASGEIRWTLRDGATQSVSGNVTVKPANDYHPDLQAFTGGPAALQFDIKRAGAAYEVDGDLRTPLASATLEKAQTDGASQFSGFVTAMLEPNEVLPGPLRDGAKADFVARYAKAERSRLDSLHVETASGMAFDGDVVWDYSRKAVAFAGEGAVSPSALGELIDGMKAAESVSVKASASGKLDALSGKLEITAPALALSEGWIPPSQSEVTFIRRDEGLAAKIAARARDRSGELSSQVSLVGDSINAQSFLLTGKNFTVKAAGAYDTSEGSGEFALTYKGEGPAQPWPGLSLAGELSAKGALARNSASNTVTVSAKDLRSDDFEIGSLEATGSGPSTNFAFNVRAEDLLLPRAGPSEFLEAAGAVDLSGPFRMTLSRFEGTAQGIDARLTAAAQFTLDDGVSVKNLRAAIGRRGSIAIDGSLSKERWLAKVSLKDAPIPGADGFASLTLDLDTARAIKANGDFTARAGVAGTPASTVAGNLLWDGERLRVTNDNPGDAIDVDLSLPLALTRTPDLGVSLKGEMSGDLAYDGRIEAFAPYLPQSLQTLEGSLKGQADLSGTIDQPEITGRAVVADGAYTELASGLSLVAIRGEATARVVNGQTAVEFNAGARGAGQSDETVTFQGGATLGETAEMNGDLSLKGVKLAAGPITSATASGDIRLSGRLDAVQAKGPLTLSELDGEIMVPESTELVEIEVIPVNGETRPASDAPPPAPPLILDVSLTADDRVFVRGRGLESEWRADLTVTGDARAPLIVGRAALRRGFLDFAGRRFALTRGEIAFDRLSRNDPTLDIRAEYEADEVTAIIEISGRASAPSVSLQSTPPRPSEDVMALVLFGKSATELSALESLQVAEALAQLTGVGPFGGRGVTSIARGALGLDLLNLNLESDTGASSLEVGKYVAEGLFVSATQDARGENGAVRVEYEITNSITVETELQQDGDQTISANWKRDF